MRRFVLAALLALPLAAVGDERTPPRDDSLQPANAVEDSPLGPVLRRERLDAILLEMSWQPQRSQSAWQRVWNWMEELSRARDVDFDWLRLWFDVPRSTREWLSRLSIGAMALLALGVIVNEIRHGHWRRWRRMHAAAGNLAPEQAPATLTLADVADLPMHERPGAALRCVLATLRGDGQTIAADGDTHRDIVAAVERHPVAGTSELVDLTNMAEKARFGGWQPKSSDGEEAIALGRAVLRHAGHLNAR